jgi:para-nitrobenzyl esterase
VALHTVDIAFRDIDATMELPFLFGSAQAWSHAEMLGPARSIDEQLGLELRTCWTQFAHRGVESLPAGPLVFG